MNVNNLAVSDPNFSVVVPGRCVAKCKLCFWQYEPAGEDYIDVLCKTMEQLPGQFNQLSLTGGEPTSSPFFVRVLNSINRGQFKKVVLTTNGYHLDIRYHINNMVGVVDHVNVSRHDVSDIDNWRVFNVLTDNRRSATHVIPDTETLKYSVNNMHNVGINVNLNCVLCQPSWTHKDAQLFIDYARMIGADSVCFRVPHGTINPTDIESYFVKQYGILGEYSCPVCRTVSQSVDGFPVLWKSSVSEPSKDLGSIYELIFHPDGSLTADWGKSITVDM